MKKRTFGLFAVVALAALVLVPAVALGCMKIQVPVSADQGGKVSAEVVYADKDTPIIRYENTVSIGWTTVTATADAGYKFDKWIVACADKMKVQNGTSIKATFKQSQGISILKQPESVTVEKGKQAEFSVVAQGGSGKYMYQWKLNGKPLYGKTDAKLVISAASAKDEEE